MCTLLQAPALEWHAVPPGSTAASAGGEGEGRPPGGCRGAIPAADGRQRLGHGPPAPPSAAVPGASQGRSAATSGSGRPGSAPGADSGRRKIQQCVGCRAADPAGAPHHPPLTLLPPPAGAPSPPPLSPPLSLHGLLAGPFEWDRRAHGVSRRVCKVWSGPLRCCPEADYRITFLGFDARGLECRTRHKTSLTAQCMLTAGGRLTLHSAAVQACVLPAQCQVSYIRLLTSHLILQSADRPGACCTYINTLHLRPRCTTVLRAEHLGSLRVSAIEHASEQKLSEEDSRRAGPKGAAPKPCALATARLPPCATVA